MKTKALKFFRDNWIMAWLIIVAALLTTVISHAAYTGTTTEKRVVSLSSRDDILFSSRYMSKAGTDMQPLLFNYADGTTPSTPVIMVDVCNYDINSNVYGTNFKFKLKARIVYNDGTEITAAEWNDISSKPTAYKVSFQSVSSGTLNEEYVNGLSQSATTLTNEFAYVGAGQEYQFNGSDKTRYIFKTEYDVNDIINANSAYGIEIVAEVVGQHSDLSNISGKLRVLKGGSSTETTWKGKFMDITANRSPADYDGINYQIYGNAVGTVTLRYRSDCVEIDKDCLTMLNPTETTTASNYKTLKIPVDPTNRKSVYDIKFYWVDGPVSSLGFNEDFIKTTFN